MIQLLKLSGLRNFFMEQKNDFKMQIKNIKLQNYRNYDDFEIDLGENLNIIIGNNAQGKTNLLESIYVLAVTKSFLSISDKGLIKFNNKFAKISGNIKNGISRNNNLEIVFSDKGKIVKVNGKEIKKLSDYISIINVIIFSTDNIRIFKESPNSRRKYFNIQISQINKNYLKYLGDYNTLLKQRNEFLKVMNINKKSDIDYLDILNEKYVSLSIEISNYRRKYVDDINIYLNDMFKYITGIEGLKLIYHTSVDSDKKLFKDKLESNLNKELVYKMTLIGPNRDDYCFKLNDKDLSLYGSQGQMRSAVLALKMSEVKLFTDETKDSPILLLDDIFSELDIEKRNNLLSSLSNNVQTVITTTDIENITEDIRKKANVYEIVDGNIISIQKNNEDGEVNGK